ncbi:MAG TPA: lysozyme inhibitor LprI family protein [Xanthobacteraceae bacterium]|nr:lysozyme inhibitor LprI family protein [Xanthobacteraceae bacterium]
MRRSTELVLMIVGCAALVVAAILLPALLLTPPAKVDRAAKEPPPAPRAEASGPLPAEPTRLPPVVQLPDPPLPRASETNTQPDQVAGSPSEPARPAESPASTGTVDAGAPREVAKPADQTEKSSDEVAAVAPHKPKDTAKSDEQATASPATASPANAPNDGTNPSDQVAMLPPSELKQDAKPEQPAVAPTENAPSAGVAPSEPSAARLPSEPKDAAKSDEQATASPATASPANASPATASPANAPNDGANPSDQVAMLPPSELKQDAKPEQPAVAPTENAPSAGVAPSGPSAAGVPSEPTPGSDLRMPTVEPPVSSDIGAAPEASESSAKVAAVKPEEPTGTGRASDQVSTSAPARQPAQVRTPWWCSNPRGDDVAAVCGNGELLALDAELNALYAKLMARERSAELRNAQRQWLAERQSCGADMLCLKRHYEKRIDELARM